MSRLFEWLLSIIGLKRAPMPSAAPTLEPPVDPSQLSRHFHLAEFTRSHTADLWGIDNTPGPAHLANLRLLAETLEHVRAVLGHPIIISSGYRSPELNRAVGGSATSDHANGLAADFSCPGYGSVKGVCEVILASGIPFDQLIYEQGATEWVHIGIGSRMRQQALSWSPSMGYVSGIRRLT